MPSSVVFDHPTPAALARWIAGQLGEKPETPVETPDTPVSMFSALAASGHFCPAANLLASASAMPIDRPEPPLTRPVEPTTRSDGPLLICLPSLSPAGAAEFLDCLTDAALPAADRRQFVLLGRSSGGLLGHAVTDRLERRGRAPAGLVLLGTYASDTAAAVGAWLQPRGTRRV